jgi:hypothetical protein
MSGGSASDIESGAVGFLLNSADGTMVKTVSGVRNETSHMNGQESTMHISRPGQRRSSLRRRQRANGTHELEIEPLEDRRLLTADFDWDTYEFRSIDGSGNNSENPSWGRAGIRLIRMAPADYRDGSGEMILEPEVRENPRVISNQIAAQGEEVIFNDRQMSDFVWQWGQFLDHDTDLTHADAIYGTADIPMPEGGDAYFGDNDIPFARSMYELDEAEVRQQTNLITAFVDASNVYGSDPARAQALRAFDGGKLRTGDGGLLPLNDEDDPLPNAGEEPGDPLFLAGDERANEQVALTSMHTLFVREHNRLADRIAELDPTATDEQIYQLARKIVGAEMQVITYEEFLPALLGKHALPHYKGYDATVNPSIANEFATAFYRLGHSLLSPQLLLMEEHDGVDILPLREAFFNRDFLTNDPGNLDRVLGGLAFQNAQEIDNKIIDDVRNFLFGLPGHGGMDLACLNIQRGRDHGLPDYNALREAYGLERVQDFHQISSEAEVQLALQELYGTVDNIDPWVGALAEDHVPRASVGPLIYAALVDQFSRLRDGDRFFYLNDRDLYGNEIKRIINLKKVTLSKIIQFNTVVEALPKDVFHVEAKTTRVIEAWFTEDGGLPIIDSSEADTVAVNRVGGDEVRFEEPSDDDGNDLGRDEFEQLAVNVLLVKPRPLSSDERADFPAEPSDLG